MCKQYPIINARWLYKGEMFSHYAIVSTTYPIKPEVFSCNKLNTAPPIHSPYNVI